MKIEITKKDIEADIEVIFVKEIKEDKDRLEFLGFKCEDEEACLIDNKLYVGCQTEDSDELRLACATALKSLKKTKAKSIKLKANTNIQALSEGFILASYSFDKYKSKKNENNIKNIYIYSSNEIQNSDLKVGSTIANATNFAKDLVNEIPYEMHSLKLEEIAKTLESIKDVTCNSYGKEFLEEQNMGAFLAVNRASHIPPRLLHVIYKPKNAKEKFVYVGKGLTYDTGGLSLKPGNHMVTMKSDMSGSAAVLSILKGAAELELPFEVHAIIGATENAIGPEAYKPDDVLTAKNGKTIEIRNTDAEGRLVLADCLCYACEQKPDYLIDMATLTGACVVALGDYTTGVMGHSSELKHSLAKYAKMSGELTGSLPFNRYLKKLLKSSIADISNISSSSYGGAITAGLFLDNFVADDYKDKWLHLDIAGPAYVEKDWGYNQCGASGAGVRMNLYWMIEKSKEEEA